MLLEAIIVIIVILGTIVNTTVMAIKDIMAINISNIGEIIIVTIAIDQDNTTPDFTGIITIETPGIIVDIVITRAIRASLNI